MVGVRKLASTLGTRRSTRLSVAVLLVVLGVVAYWTLLPTEGVEVSTAPVTTGPISRQVVATGTLQAVTTVQIGTQVSGVVRSLEADYNSIVHAGQVVARLDPALYVAQLEQARAAEGEAEANLFGFEVQVEDAETKLTRAETLAAEQIIAPADLDATRIAADEARASARDGEGAVAQTKAAVAQAAANLEHTVIRTPIDGIVIERKVDIGQTLAASIQSPVLFRIAADLQHMHVEVDVDQGDVGGLREGEPAAFEVESYPDVTFHGTVTQLRLQPVAQQTATATTVGDSSGAPTTSVVATVVSYTAIVDVENPDKKLRPGMTAQVALAGSHLAQAVRIPNSALTFRPPPEVLRALGQVEPPMPEADSTNNDTKPREVWQYDGKRFTRLAVHVGLADEQWTELASGSIHPGDELATSAVVRQRSLR